LWPNTRHATSLSVTARVIRHSVRPGATWVHGCPLVLASISVSPPPACFHRLCRKIGAAITTDGVPVTIQYSKRAWSREGHIWVVSVPFFGRSLCPFLDGLCALFWMPSESGNPPFQNRHTSKNGTYYISENAHGGLCPRVPNPDPKILG
jgi:hypothetical protein